MGDQSLEYRLSKGLVALHGASRDVRVNPRQEGPQPCAACGREIAAGEPTMWLVERPYHVACGKTEVERREAEIRAELMRRLAPRTNEAGGSRR